MAETTHCCACSLIADSAQVVYGPEVVANRTKFELAYLFAASQVIDPLGFTIRYLNYTSHPSLTPGASTDLLNAEAKTPAVNDTETCLTSEKPCIKIHLC